MPKYNNHRLFEVTDIPSPTTTTWTVPTTALTTSPHLPQVLSTPHLIEAMQSTTLNVLTANFKNAHCEVAVPGRISITHSAPVCAGVTLTLTTEFRGQEGTAVKFAVTAADAVDSAIVARAMFWVSVVCSVNLESAAFLRQRPEARAASLAGTVPNCPGGTGHVSTPRPSPLLSPPSAFSKWESTACTAVPTLQSGPPPPCQLCHPIRRACWRGPAFEHNRVSRGFLHAVHHGPEQLVAAWVESGVELAPYLDSALYAAVIASRPGILDILVEKAGGDPRAWKSDYLSVGGLLHLAVQNRSSPAAQQDMVRALLRHGVNPNSYNDEYYWTPLHHAVRLGTIEIVKILLDAGADPDFSEDEAWTSLHFAVQEGDVPIVKLLVERGADLEARNTMRDTPLMMAVRLGGREVARALLEGGCKPDLREARGSVMEWLEGAEVRDLSGPVRCLRP